VNAREPQLPALGGETGSASVFTPRLILGIGIVVFGVLLLLDNLDVLEADDFLRYLFPAVLLGVGAVQVASRIVWGWLWLVAGGWTMLSALGILEISFWKLFWPLALVTVGVTMLGRGLIRPLPRSSAAADRESVVHAFAFMSGNERRSDSTEFRGGDLFAFMGGVTLDLRHATPTADGAVLDVFAWWGGIEVRVPDNWRVISEVVPLLGGFEDNTKPSADPSAVAGRLVLRGAVIMGGIEVKN
jgi:hypothetical protein